MSYPIIYNVSGNCTIAFSIYKNIDNMIKISLYNKKNPDLAITGLIERDDEKITDFVNDKSPIKELEQSYEGGCLSIKITKREIIIYHAYGVFDLAASQWL
jgi:hypothetical protein